MERIVPCPLRPLMCLNCSPGAEPRNCFHCGTRCGKDPLASDQKLFCREGCLVVYELLSQNGLTEFYGLADVAGVRVQATREHQFRFVDEPQVRSRLVEFQDERITRSLSICPPSIASPVFGSWKTCIGLNRASAVRV
jgi:hypothetical protein